MKKLFILAVSSLFASSSLAATDCFPENGTATVLLNGEEEVYSENIAKRIVLDAFSPTVNLTDVDGKIWKSVYNSPSESVYTFTIDGIYDELLATNLKLVYSIDMTDLFTTRVRLNALAVKNGRESSIGIFNQEFTCSISL